MLNVAVKEELNVHMDVHLRMGGRNPPFAVLFFLIKLICPKYGKFYIIQMDTISKMSNAVSTYLSPFLGNVFLSWIVLCKKI